MKICMHKTDQGTTWVYVHHMIYPRILRSWIALELSIIIKCCTCKVYSNHPSVAAGYSCTVTVCGAVTVAQSQSVGRSLINISEVSVFLSCSNGCLVQRHWLFVCKFSSIVVDSGHFPQQWPWQERAWGWTKICTYSCKLPCIKGNKVYVWGVFRGKIAYLCLLSLVRSVISFLYIMFTMPV